MRLQLQGIGAALGSDDGKTMVKEIIAGGPAADDKRLKVGDQITGVGQGENGEIVDVVDMNLSRVVQMIRGKAGTTVTLGTRSRHCRPPTSSLAPRRSGEGPRKCSGT